MSGERAEMAARIRELLTTEGDAVNGARITPALPTRIENRIQ